MLGDCVRIEINVFGVTDAFPKEAKIATALQRVQFLVETRTKLGQKQQMEMLYYLNIAVSCCHKMIIRVIDTNVEYAYLHVTGGTARGDPDYAGKM